MCAHGGQAQPTVPFTRVLVNGMPVTTLAPPYAVTSCPSGGNGTCVSAQWTTGAAARVVAGGQPVLLQSSQAICAPTGSPLTILVTQTRVTGV